MPSCRRNTSRSDLRTDGVGHRSREPPAPPRAACLQGSGGTLAALGDSQRDALAYLAIRLYWIGFGYALLFFAGFCVLIGVLIRHSRLIAHPAGSLMVLAGACYLVNSLALIVAPGAAGVLYPWILLPSFVGELSLAVWLLVKGVDAAA